MSKITIDAQRQTGTTRLTQLTLAHALLIAVGVLAAIIRLVNLDGLPLSPDEAAQAWTVWATTQPETIDLLLSGSPAYFTLTRLLMTVLGDGDAVMRLVPALFGVGAVLLPWLWRSRLGTVGALAASLLLMASPLHVVTARTVGGESIAVFALLLLVIAYDRWRETAVRAWLYTLAAALGLGLASAPIFYGGIVTLAVAWGIQRAIGLPLFAEEAADLEWEGRRTAVGFGIVVFVAASTLLLWYPAGLGTAARLPAAWLAAFGGGGPISDPFLTVARYEPILLTLGVIAILWATWRSHPFASFCVYWIAAVFLLMLVQAGNTGNAVLLTLPGILLLSAFADAQLQRISALDWGVAGGVLIVLALAFVNLGRFARRVAFEPNQLGNVWMILFAFAFTLVALYFVSTWDLAATYRGVLLAVFGFFLFYTWGTAWWLSHHAANDPRARWATVGTDDDVRVMIPVVDELAQQVGNGEDDLTIFSSVDSPLLRWYLRHYAQVEFSDAVPVGANHDVIISPAETEPALGSDYMGGDYGLLLSEPPPPEQPGATPVLDTLRWWLFHESNATVPQQRVILWLRADLVSNEE